MKVDATRRATRATVEAPDAPAPPGRSRHWRERGFGPTSETPYRRRWSDWIRVLVATALLVPLSRRAGELTQTERDITKLFRDLPGGLHPLFRLFYGLGTTWAVGLVLAAALVGRRWRLTRDLAIGGSAAWVVARWSFPLSRVAVVAAIVFVASPYVSRPTRRVGHVLLFLLAAAAMYLDAGKPAAMLGGIVLGWGIAAAVHLVFGSPGGRPTARQVTAALDELGIAARNVRLAARQPTGFTLMLGTDAVGPLSVRVIGRDESDGQAMSRFWRFVVYKDAGPQLYFNRQHDVEHEAYTMLLAERAGVRVPAVVGAGKAGPGAALIVSRPPSGTPLSDAPKPSVTDELLCSVWHQVAVLRAAGIAHGRLNSAAVVLADAGPAIVDFDIAGTTTQTARRSADVAELLTSTAGIVGDERAVAAAVRELGPDAVAAALPMLQPAVLSRATRHGMKHKELERRMTALREEVARATGVEVPPLQQLHRVSGSNLAMAIGTLVALVVLMGQIGSPQQMWETIKNANWWWAVLAFVLSLATNFGYAIALMGSVPNQLPLLTTTETELAMSFSNLAIPAIGGIAMQIRYLQKQGVPLASAVAAGGFLTGFANGVESIALFCIAIALSPASFRIGDIPTSSVVAIVLIVILVAGVAAGLLFGLPRLRRRVMPPLTEALRTLWSALRSPRQLVLLFAGNILATLLYSFVMVSCILAFGGSISFWTVLALNIGVSTIASMVPVPGGTTAVGTIGMSGGLTAVGVSTEVAVAAVLLDQIVVTYLPAAMGWFATRHLMQRGYI